MLCSDPTSSHPDQLNQRSSDDGCPTAYNMLDLRTYSTLLQYIDNTAFGIGRPRVVPDNLRIPPYLLSSFVGSLEINVAAEDDGALTREERRHRGAVAPSFANAADAGYEDDLVAEVVDGHYVSLGMDEQITAPRVGG